MKQRIKQFFNKLKSKLGVTFSKLKNGYIILCKWFNDMIHNRAGNTGLLLSFACIVFICVVEPIIDIFHYSNSLWLLVVGEIIYALFTVFFVSSTILYNRRGICYWITSLLLIVRYITLIGIGAEWNRQFGIYYLGLAFIFFCSWGSWVSAKDINRKGGIFDTVILAIGLALFVMGLISKNGDYQYYKYLIVSGIALIYLYAIARSILQIFFSHNNIKIDLFKTMVYVVIYIALIVGLPFLLKYAGVKEEILSGTIIPIYAAAIGGILTLAGVAWTIKHNEKQQVLQARLDIKPFIAIDNSKSLYDFSEMIEVSFQQNSSEMKLGRDDTYCFGKPVFSNIGNDAFIIKYIRINDEKIDLRIPQVIMPNQMFYIKPNNQLLSIYVENQKLQSISLGIYDKNYNLYEYPILFTIVAHASNKMSIFLSNISDHFLVTQPNGMVLYKNLKFDYVDCSTIDCKREKYIHKEDIGLEQSKVKFKEELNINFDDVQKGDEDDE